MTNTNTKTGIRFGVIAMQKINPDVEHDLFYGWNAKNVSEEQALAELKAEVTAEADALEESAREDFLEEFGQKCAEDQDMVDSAIENAYMARGYQDRDDFIQCECEKRGDFQIEEPTIEGTYEGVEYMIGWLGGAPLLWIVEGPVGRCQSLCSPCVPNAGDLDSGFETGRSEIVEAQYPHECYVVPKDWLRGET